MRHVLLLLVLAAGCGAQDPILDAAVDSGPACPADPPADGAACSGDARCSWLRCESESEGAVSATCDAGAWSIEATPCPVACEGASCTEGQLCRVREGGALLTDCAPDPCAGAPLEACACSLCPDPGACTISGFTVRCDTCASEICP